MASIKRNSILGFWFLLVSLCLTECDYDTSNVEPEIDLTGQKGIVVDIDGNTYQTIGIGTQIWMAENLYSRRLNDGTTLPQVTNDSIWGIYHKPAYCFYRNDSTNYNNGIGLLYNFYSVKTELLCPVGWRIPSTADWTTLSQFLGGFDKAGGKLKQMQSPFWQGPNFGFDTDYEFNALPSGRRRYGFGSAKFEEFGIAGYWWTTDSLDYFKSLAVSIKNSSTNLDRNYFRKTSAFSIRCIKN